jgi:hypothetical protein
MAPFGQQLESNPAIHACRDMYVKLMAREMDLASRIALGGQTELLTASELQLLKQITGESSPIRLIHRLLKAEQERKQQLVQMMTPIKGLLESMQLHTRDMARVAQASATPSHRMVEANALAAIRTITINCQRALSDFHAPVQIHALPRLAELDPSRPGRYREFFHGKTEPSRVPEAPSQSAPTGWLEESLDDEGGRRILEQLCRFVRSEEIPSDAREGMDFLLALWRLRKTGISRTERHQLHLTVVGFLRRQLGVLPPAGGLQLLGSGLLVPHSRGKIPVPDLAPEIFTTQQLAKKLPSTTDTLKRHAKKAFENGPLPQPMPAFPGWFVVSQSDPKGGQGWGWKFQQCRQPQKC